jgi:VCBS repeat-containing protein
VALISNDNPLQAALGTLTASMTADTTGVGSGGHLAWNYSVSDAAIAFLAAGQVVHETYQVTFANNLGQTTNQSIAVTITGTNDAPVVVASPANVTSGAVTEYGSIHGNSPATTEAASGAFAFSDADLTDTHALSPVALIANDSPLHAPLGTLTAALASDTTGIGTGGQVTWSYTVSDAAIAFLTTGQVVHETYAITVNDNHGGSTTQDVTVTITGDNENFAPIAQSDLVSTAVNLPATVNVLANDFDQNIGDTISLVSVGAASHGLAVANPLNGTVLYTPTAGFQGADTFDYTITDTHGATTTATATVIVGTFLHQQVGTDVFLENHLIEVGVNGGGSFGSANAGPAGYSITATTGQVALNVDPGGFGVTPLTTGDFALPGVPEDAITIGYNDGTNHNLTNDERVAAVGNQIATTTTDISSGTHLGAVTHGSADGVLDFTQTVGFDVSDTYITTTVTLINTSGHALDDVRFLRSMDPDQDQIFHGTYDTINSVVHNPGDGSGIAATKAVGPISGIDVSFVSFDSGAVASATQPNVVNHDAFAAQVSSNPTNVNAQVDAQTNIDLDFGAMAAGETITKTYYTTFNTPSAGNDLLLGDNNTHNLSGGAGNDIIIGSTGNDVINGGTGNDKLYGAGGSNTFVFDLNSGKDTIADFHVGTDHIFFTPGQGFSTAGPVNGDFNGDGVVDTKVALTDGSTITLLGVNVTDPHFLL